MPDVGVCVCCFRLVCVCESSCVIMFVGLLMSSSDSGILVCLSDIASLIACVHLRWGMHQPE